MTSASEVGKRQSVYVVIGGPKHVKIGISEDVQNRLKGIQTGCPFEVRLAKSWRTPFAPKIERLAHIALNRYRAAGEWFNVPVRVATAIIEALIDVHSRNGRKTFDGAIVFCSWCRHSTELKDQPHPTAKFRCSKCNSREHVHVINLRSREKTIPPPAVKDTRDPLIEPVRNNVSSR